MFPSLVWWGYPRLLRRCLAVWRLFLSLRNPSTLACLCSLLRMMSPSLTKCVPVGYCCILLQPRAPYSWLTVECLQVLRHGVKLWGRSYTELWDSLLVRMVWQWVWQWVGHVLRQPESSLARSVLLGLQPARHQRRLRTGPNNSGHRSILRYLQHRNIPVETATDRQQWRNPEEPWLRHNGFCGPVSRANVFAIACDKHMWARRCLQGAYHGQRVYLPCDRCWGTMLLENDHVPGWRKHSFPGDCLRSVLEGILATAWVHPRHLSYSSLAFPNAQ